MDIYIILKEKKFFELLLIVKGVGPKSAMALLTKLSIDHIIQALQQENAALLRGVPGVGAKTAQQIILDLNNKSSNLWIH
jgi:Holliday junction DNA helicase RuvA